MIFFTSDLHLGHENCIRLCNRPFSSIEEMDETLIENWNHKVTGKDTVYILGDLIYRSQKPPEEYLRRLRGKKHLILGNHDRGWIRSCQTERFFESVNIIAWNDTIIDGHNRYEICNKMRIPYGVKELDFPSRDAAIAWICANQLGRRNISEETRKYLIGKQYEVEKKVQRNRNGYNQYRPNPNIAVGRGRPIDEESGRRTAARLGRKYHVSGATVQKYAKYSAALDTIEQNAPELVPHILSGAYKISFENIVALSEMEPEELRALSKKIGKNPYAFARYSESRRCLYSDASAKPGTAAAEQPAIKTMPAYDPDAEVAGLTLTIPSWMSSIDRTKSMAHLEAISPAARQNLLAALTELEGKIQEMLNAIEGES